MKCCLMLVYVLYLDNEREQVRRLPTRCVSSMYVCIYIYIYIYIYITVVLGLKSRVVTVGIRALGLDPKDH